MPIVGIGHLQAADQGFVARHQGIGDRQVHQVGGAVQLFRRQVLAVTQHAALPLIMNLHAPPRPEAAGQTQPHQEVAQGGRVEHAGVIDRGEVRVHHS